MPVGLRRGDDHSFDELGLVAIASAERDARLARAELRQLEQDTGRTASANGVYWLARTTALERVAAMAALALQKGDMTILEGPLDALEAVPAPRCHPQDHSG